MRHLLLPLLLSLAACGSDPVKDSACVPPFALFTDIDETLTLTDEEWLQQLSDPSYDPALRPDADTLMKGYAELGYTVVYVTARGQDMTLLDGRGAWQATYDWLLAHDFPCTEETVVLSEGIGVMGDPAVEYKSAVVRDWQDQGWTASYGYGNADTDILAWQAAGIPNESIFLVGELAGTMGVVGIPDDQAYTGHLGWLDSVPPVECP